jgi:hypothetical protein
MRALTEEEKQTYERRKAMLDEFVSESMPVMADFAERLGLPEPTMIVNDPESYLPAIDAFMRNQVVKPDDRVWIITRLMYIVGEVLIQRLGGIWLLNDIPDSKFFLKYVVGDFSGIKRAGSQADAGAVAHRYVMSDPPRRSLVDMIDETVADLHKL